MQNNVIISNMEIQDLNSIANILETDFDNFWNYNVFKEELTNEISKYLVAKINNQIVGFAGIIPVLDEADISNIVVNKNFRNQKIGSLLLEALFDLAISLKIQKINLEVRKSNVPAIKLYEKYGFEVCGVRKNYYSNIEDAILMKKVLT